MREDEGFVFFRKVGVVVGGGGQSERLLPKPRKIDSHAGAPSTPQYTSTCTYRHHRDNGMYYGGDPPAWTTTPAIPADARYESLSAATAAAAAGPSKSAPVPSFQQQQQPIGKRIEKSAHPLSGIGGFRLPATGTVGGARGVGVVGGGVSKPTSALTAAKKSTTAAKAATSGKPMSQEEKEAIAKREAARARVAARNAAQFGM